MSKQSVFIVVSGPIGVGKSTVTRTIAETTDFNPQYEPFEVNPFLARFYADPVRWAFPTQIDFLSRRWQSHMDALITSHNVIADRSIYEDAIFAKVLNQRGEMPDDEYATYISLFNRLVNFHRSPDLILYLSAPTDILMGRIDKRSRDMEKKIPREYIEQLNEAYEDYYVSLNTPALKVNTDRWNFVAEDPVEREEVFDFWKAKMNAKLGRMVFPWK